MDVWLSDNDMPPAGVCKFYNSSVGCKRGQQCTFRHILRDGDNSARCWVCGSQEHWAANCTAGRSQAGGPPSYGGGKPDKGGKGPPGGGDGSGGQTGSGNGGGGKGKPTGGAVRQTRQGESQGQNAADGGGQGGGNSGSGAQNAVEESGKTAGTGGQPVGDANNVAANANVASLVTQAQQMLKSFRGPEVAMKKFFLKTVKNAETALLDGGATHPLRQARE